MMISDLPRDMVEEVLCKLPMTSLRRARFTCKRWNNTLSKDWRFTRKYNGEAAKRKEFQVVMILEYKVYLMSVNVHNPSPSIEPIGKLHDAGVDIINVFHCQGLLLCVTKGGTRLVVWNPFTGQTRWIKPRDSYHRCDRYALGYENKNNYPLKVLRFVDDYDRNLKRQVREFEIFNLNSSSWKVVDFNPHWMIQYFYRGLSLKGNTYWFAENKVAPGKIGRVFLLCFNFTTESFGPRLLLPFHGRYGDTLTLSSVREEQLAVLFQECAPAYTLKVWISSKDEHVNFIAFGQQIPVSTQLDGPSMFNPSQSQSFDDFEAYNKQQPNRSRALAAEKEKMNAVAKIKVVVRKRPLNKKESVKNEEDIIDTHSNCLTVHETKVKVDLTAYVEKHEFVFDAVLDEEVSNDEVYRETVEPVVPLIFQRIKATCFAYGQTGSGKTYTMKPLPLKASRDILRLMHHTYRNQGFQLFVSFFEIYGGKLYDLLSERKKLCMREDGKQQVCIVGLQEYRVSDTDAIVELIERGSATRSTGTTGANEESSRSHAILQLAIKKSAEGNQSKPPRLVGKLSFIDLAGSERGADTTDNDKQTRLEGAEINKSLLALKECIRALDNDQGHIPFRGSKLTEVLRDSFMGNSRTVMISCISPSSGSCEHTLNTLRYADRVKSLSKGNGSKKDVSSSTLNLRESTKVPLSTALPAPSNYEDDVNEMWNEENDEFDASDYEQEKQMWKKNVKPEVSYAQERIQKPNIPMKSRDMPRPDMKKSSSDDNLNALLQIGFGRWRSLKSIKTVEACVSELTPVGYGSF
ncbi:hypothetical protein F2Q68_00032542, partial [Brassica cretica]